MEEPHSGCVTAEGFPGPAPGRGPVPAVPAVPCYAPRDLRGVVAPSELRFPAGARVVVSGLPGSGKSTLMRDAVRGTGLVSRVDSQDVRERWERRLPHWLPYGLYRPLVRLAHYAGLRGALASGMSVVVHDCGSRFWVRRWLAVDARRRGRAFHLVLLDVPPPIALAGQAERGRGVSARAFARHRRAVRRLLSQAEAGGLPAGCESVVLIDRAAARALRGMLFEQEAPCGRGRGRVPR